MTHINRGPNRNAPLTPWILGFQGTEPPEPLLEEIRKGRVSGLLLFRDNLGGSVTAALELRRRILSYVPAGRPFLFMIDEEGGLISQTSALESPTGRWPAVPTPRALGRIGRVAEVVWVARLLGRRLRSLGIRVDLAPCLDLDRARENPIIGSRSFGTDPVRVAHLGGAFARGLHQTGVASCFKHYPGHGGTRLDSHLTLPSMEAGELREHELAFRMALDGPAGGSGSKSALVPWVMSAHVDWGSGIPASQDRRLLSRVHRWSPSSLVVTDALDMRAVSIGHDAAVESLKAGNNVLIVGRDWKAGIDAIDRLEGLVSASGAGRDRALAAAMRRAGRRMAPVWEALSSAGTAGSSDGSGLRIRSGSPGRSEGPGGPESPGKSVEDRARLRKLHRLAVRLSVDPALLPEGEWTWVIPEGLTPYVRLEGWEPPRARRRICREVLWIPENASGAELQGIANRLGRSARKGSTRSARASGSPRPILVATLFRGIPTEDRRRGWLSFLRAVRPALVAHLLDEGWPGVSDLADVDREAVDREGVDLKGVPVACTSGPSRESLAGLAEALDLPRTRWKLGKDDLYFPVDS